MNLLESTTKLALEDLQNKKLDAVKKQLVSMGRSDVVEAMNDPGRFSKLGVEKRPGWEIYFVDNGTKMGEFVIAFEDYKCALNDTSVNISFRYTTDKSLFE